VSGEKSDPFEFSPADVDAEFSLEDTIAPRGQSANARVKAVPFVGYNPYDRKAGGKPPPQAVVEPRRKPTDLRKLSEWIRLQREVEALKKEKPEDP
jgi:hypothetical protein